jgi:hypothetical protein
MKAFTHSVAASFILTLACNECLGAGPPGLDRPSPPACCADGLCYPNPTTWGVYGTRWRRWPTERLEPTPATVEPPVTPSQEIPPFERPPAEKEEQAAPPPTRAAEELREQEEEREDQAPRTAPPGTPSGTVPFGTPTDTPAQPPSPLENNRPTPPGMTFPWEQPAPTTPPTTPLDESTPTGDYDPPPAPPFGNPSLAERTDLPVAPPAAQPVQRRVVPRRSPSDDPPPAFPIAMAVPR